LIFLEVKSWVVGPLSEDNSGSGLFVGLIGGNWKFKGFEPNLSPGINADLMGTSLEDGFWSLRLLSELLSLSPF